MLLNLFVTYKCNLKCKYCYEQKNINKPVMINDKTADDFLLFVERNYSEHEFIWINFHGGEPLLNFRIIKKIVRGIFSRYNCMFSITTNGTILSKKILKFLYDNHFFISLSVDGIYSVHDSNRMYADGSGSLERVIKNIRNIEHFERVRFRMTVTSTSLNKLYDSIIFISSFGVKTIVIIPDYFFSNWDVNSINKFGSEITRAKKKLQHSNSEIKIFHPFEKCYYGQCTGGTNEVTINTDGTLYPCTLVYDNDDYSIGTLNTGINFEKLRHIKSESVNNTRFSCDMCKMNTSCLPRRCIFLNNKSRKVMCDFKKCLDNEQILI